jgi:hypothetical protein
MDNTKTLATFGTQDKDKQNKNNKNTSKKMNNTYTIKGVIKK